jgi:integrase
MAAIDTFVAKLLTTGISNKRVNNVTGALGSMLGWAFDKGYLATNFRGRLKKLPVADVEMKYLTIEQAKALVDAFDPFYRPFVTFAIHTGLRLSELRALTWDDIDFERTDLHVRHNISAGVTTTPKTRHSNRHLSLPPFLVQVLLDHKAVCPPSPEGYVFPQPTGRVLDPSNFRKRVLLPAFEKAGIPPVRFHDLRHTCASLLIDAGASLYDVMSWLGHSNVTTTLRYAHWLPGAQQRTADLLQEHYGGTPDEDLEPARKAG